MLLGEIGINILSSIMKYPEGIFMDQIQLEVNEEKNEVEKCIEILLEDGYIEQRDIGNRKYTYRLNRRYSNQILVILDYKKNGKGGSLDKDYIWFAVYGAEMCYEYFSYYIKGGFCLLTNEKFNGCRDKELPAVSVPILIPYELYWGNQSGVWDGSGVPFLDLNNVGKTFGRMFLIKKEQFEEIWERKIKGDRWYNYELKLGAKYGIDIVCVTNIKRRYENLPSENYLKIMGKGMKEVYSSSDTDKYIKKVKRGTAIHDIDIKRELKEVQFQQQVSEARLLTSEERMKIIEEEKKLRSKKKRSRSPYVVAECLERAAGICEYCGKDAPFIRKSDGTPYLEVHHKQMLSEGGADILENTMATCPNCHRYCHLGIKS